MASFSKLTKFLNLMMNGYYEEKLNLAKSNDSQSEDNFTFTKGLKSLQNLTLKHSITSLKSAIFSTSKVSQAVNRKQEREQVVLEFRKHKAVSYLTYAEQEDLNIKYCNLREFIDHYSYYL